jgi:hypothetical protein
MRKKNWKKVPDRFWVGFDITFKVSALFSLFPVRIFLFKSYEKSVAVFKSKSIFKKKIKVRI